MKQARFIIENITHKPSFKNLHKIKCYKKLIAPLPLHVSQKILFMYNKNKTLYFVFGHPGDLMSFNNIQRQNKYKQSLVKTILKKLIQIDKSCECIDADEIKAFVSNKQRPLQVSEDVFVYEERSMGTFINYAKNEKLNELFEQIRDIICLQKP